jgi:predicted P-loop ATPase
MSENKKLTKRQKTEMWLSQHYQLRYNTIKATTEVRKLSKKDKPFEEITERELQTILRKMDAETDIGATTNTLSSVILSDYASRFNPISHYFNNLNFSDDELNKDYTEIQYLSDCVFMKHKEHTPIWNTVFKAFLVSCVANSLNETGCQNQTCLVFTGTGGAFKTTFLNCLCPEKLSEYLYTGQLDLKSKDTFIMLGQNFLINIDDQLDSLFKSDSEMMKTLITTKENKRRLPHAKFVTNIPRIANFTGSINHTEFLRDTTGNRRFLPFEIGAIEIDTVQKKVNIDKVWYEAYQLYKSGFKYWFSKSELDELFGAFDDFYVVSPEEELIKTYLEIPTQDKDILKGQFVKLTVSEIVDYLTTLNKSARLSTRTAGQILKKLSCLTSTRSGGARCYIVRKKDLLELDKEREVNEKF